MQHSTQATTKTHSDKTRIAQRFSAAAKSYDSVALLQKEIGTRLCERLDFIQNPEFQDKITSLQPLESLEAKKSFIEQDANHCLERILDLGSGTGFFSRLMGNKFPDAHIINLDLSSAMLLEAKLNAMLENKKYCNEFSYICADAELLPLAPNTLNLIFSNCALQWCLDYFKFFTTAYQSLKQKGTLIFSTFGPDTLIELRNCFKTVDNETHVNTFTDMHLLGDALLRAKFSFPVVDREIMTLHYSSVIELFRDLKLMGATQVHGDSPTGLMTKQKLNKVIAAYENYRDPTGMLPASFEVIYGYARKF